MSLEVELCGLRLRNPFIAASGTFGYGVEYEGLLDSQSPGRSRLQGPLPRASRRLPHAADRGNARRAS